jgi:hypothetical protein
MRLSLRQPALKVRSFMMHQSSKCLGSCDRLFAPTLERPVARRTIVIREDRPKESAVCDLGKQSADRLGYPRGDRLPSRP